MNIKMMQEDIVKLITTFDSYLDNMYDRGAFDPKEKSDNELESFLAQMKKKYQKQPSAENKQYIVICLSMDEECGPDNFFQGVYKTKEAAEISQKNDMKNFLLSEIESGHKAQIVGDKIIWDNLDNGRFAKWFIYEV